MIGFGVKSVTCLFLVALIGYGQGLRVMYLGNHLIDTEDDLPGLVKALAKDVKVDITHRIIAKEGTFCEEMCNNDITEILRSCFDVVVIQEHSSKLSFGIGDVYYQTLPYCQGIVDKIRAKCPDTKFVFVQTWPHKKGDNMNCYKTQSGDILGYEFMCDWDKTMTRITETTKTMAFLATPACVAPCGEAMAYVKKNNKGMYNKKFYASDEVSPKKEMTTLCAYTLAPQIIGKAIKNLPRGPGVSKGSRKKYKKAADAALKKMEWCFNDPNGKPPCDKCINANA